MWLICVKKYFVPGSDYVTTLFLEKESADREDYDTLFLDELR